MADNVTTQSTTLATPPSGTVIATDDVAGVEYQKVKLVDGTADSTTAITGDAANGLDVDVTRVSGVVHVDDNAGSLTVDGTVTANAGTGPFPVSDNGGSLTVDDGAGSLTVDGTVTAVGDVASGSADSESPVKVGARFNSTPSTLSDGQRSDLTVNSRQALRVALTDATLQNLTMTTPSADATAPTVSVPSATFPSVFNGATWDRTRGDTTNGLDVDVTRVSGTVNTQDASDAADATTTKPSTAGLVAGWDGLAVRALSVEQHNGKNMAAVSDDGNRRLLELILLTLYDIRESLDSMADHASDQSFDRRR